MNNQENKKLNIKNENLTECLGVADITIDTNTYVMPDTNNNGVTDVKLGDNYLNRTYNNEFGINGMINPNELSPCGDYGEGEKEKQKISPFQVEDLNLIYNLERFPKRKRRKPKKLRKYSLVGSLAIVTAHKLSEKKYYNYKKDRRKAIKDLTEYIDIDESAFATKLSQLNSYIYGDEQKKEKAEKQMSKELFRAYRMFKDVDYNDLFKIFENHEIYGDALETAFISLREKSLVKNMMFKLL